MNKELDEQLTIYGGVVIHRNDDGSFTGGLIDRSGGLIDGKRFYGFNLPSESVLKENLLGNIEKALRKYCKVQG